LAGDERLGMFSGRVRCARRGPTLATCFAGGKIKGCGWSIGQVNRPSAPPAVPKPLPMRASMTGWPVEEALEGELDHLEQA
jgi:hypothetical protein